MHFREATVSDIPQIQVVRNSVKENMLSDPALVPDKDCVEFLTVRGKGWVAETNNRITGFAIVDFKENNIWALFIHPDFEKQGIGKKLQSMMLHHYFSVTKEKVWLGTAPGTRAEQFYKLTGWKEAGMHGKETKFEMGFEDWQKLQAAL